ncbi:MAG: alkaline phosphatase, partial [Lacipirellulaceae bacterium]
MKFLPRLRVGLRVLLLLVALHIDNTSSVLAQQSVDQATVPGEVIEPGIELHIEGERVVPGSVVEIPVIRTPQSVPVEMPILEQPPARPKLRNLILLIGDGMGPQQLGLLSQFAHHSKQSPYPDDPDGGRQTAIERLMNEGVVGLVRTEPYGSLVVDSAAAATQLATGQPAGSEMIGTNADGDSAETVLEVAKQSGRATGLVSDTRITHATPAAFAAHQRHRSMENEIASDLLANQVDVMLSGGLRNWIPEAAKDKESVTYAAVLQMTGGRFPVSSKRKDNRNMLLEAREDYQIVFDRQGLDRLTEGRVLGLFA